MATRILDLLLAVPALIILSPVLIVAALGVRLSSPGPVIYKAQRIGLHGRPFTMYKFRTMHVDHGGFRSAITAAVDPRVFPLGTWLRKAKIDELPQLWNVVIGDMSIVGPRPEDPRIVRDHYTDEQRETLNVRPGLSSPGSIFYYTEGEALLQGSDPERLYVEKLLPTKLALDLAYTRNLSLGYNVKVIARTIWVIARIALGGTRFSHSRK